MKIKAIFAGMIGASLAFSVAHAEDIDTGNLESIFHPNMTGEEIQLPPYDAQGTHNVCTAQWTKAGKEDREMSALCISNEKEAYRGLTRFLSKNHGFPWMHSAFDAITQKWTKYGVPDYEMILHELDSNQENYKDLKYFYDTKKADSDQLSSALEQAQNMSGYLDFEMADFNYKESANIPH